MAAACTSTSSLNVKLMIYRSYNISNWKVFFGFWFLNKGIIKSSSWKSGVMISLVQNRLYQAISQHPTHLWMCVILWRHVNVWIRAGPKQTRHVCTWNIQTCGVNVTCLNVSLWKTQASLHSCSGPDHLLKHCLWVSPSVTNQSDLMEMIQHFQMFPWSIHMYL